MEIPQSVTVKESLSSASVLQHLKNPQNLLTYLIFSAWCKFMGIASVIPTITLG